MSLSELIGPPERNSRPGVVQTWVDGLDDADREWFYAALRNPQWSSRALAAALGEKANAPFGRDALTEYRGQFLNAPKRLKEDS